MATEYIIEVGLTSWNRNQFVQRRGAELAWFIEDAKRWKTVRGAQAWLDERGGYRTEKGYSTKIIPLTVRYVGRTNRVKSMWEEDSE